MKIAIDLTSLADNFSGIERFTMNITTWLIDISPEDDFILIYKDMVYGKLVEYSTYSNVKTIVLKRKKKLWFSQVTLLRCLYGIKADFYLFMAFPTPLFFFRKGTVTTIHDIGCWDVPEAMVASSRLFFRILYRKASKFDEKIITVSEFSRQRIQSKLHIPKDRICVIYNGVDSIFFACTSDNMECKEVRKKYDLPDRYILCLSTLEPRKNIKLLINACCSLWENGMIKTDLVLAGRKGWKVSDIISDVNPKLIKKIHFTGFIDDEDLPMVYHCADVFVFPSLYEGFGIPPLEALAAGTPVISSDGSSLPEILGEAALYFRNNNQKSLERLLFDFFEGNVEGKVGIPKIYDWKESAQKFKAFLGGCM